MDYRDNPQHLVRYHIKWTNYTPPWWTSFAPPLTPWLAAQPLRPARENPVTRELRCFPINQIAPNKEVAEQPSPLQEGKNDRDPAALIFLTIFQCADARRDAVLGHGGNAHAARLALLHQLLGERQIRARAAIVRNQVFGKVDANANTLS